MLIMERRFSTLPIISAFLGVNPLLGESTRLLQNFPVLSKRGVCVINRNFLLLFLFSALMIGVQAQATVPSTDGSFWVNLPESFGPAGNPPATAILAVEIPNSGISLFCEKGEAVELDPKVYADKQKQMLFDNGAQIHGTRSSVLADKPACSFLVGGIAQGKESLFVFNQRDDGLYAFVLNYPQGQRDKAASLWNQIAPTFKFAKKE
jgi:hypothetical protein